MFFDGRLTNFTDYLWEFAQSTSGILYTVDTAILGRSILALYLATDGGSRILPEYPDDVALMVLSPPRPSSFHFLAESVSGNRLSHSKWKSDD